VLEVRERLPLLRKIVVWDMGGLRDLSDPQVIGLAALRELGRARPACPSRCGSGSPSR
jgi:long-chain acyl-CoA synthetase